MAAPDTDDLARIEAAVWQELGQAVRTKGHPWRYAVMATADGARADARTVVLREFDEAARELMIFTDARSPKVRQLGVQSQAMLVLWHPGPGWQLRLEAEVTVETSGLAVSSRWARLKMTPAAHDYLSPLPPGSTVERPLPQRGTREHFAILRARITRADWLELGPQGQRRAGFDGEGRRWLVP